MGISVRSALATRVKRPTNDMVSASSHVTPERTAHLLLHIPGLQHALKDKMKESSPGWESLVLA